MKTVRFEVGQGGVVAPEFAGYMAQAASFSAEIYKVGESPQEIQSHLQGTMSVAVPQQRLGEVEGFHCLTPSRHPRAAWLEALVVHPELRQGRGIGRALLRDALMQAKQASKEALVLEAANDSGDFYARNGFMKLSEIDAEIFVDWENEADDGIQNDVYIFYL